MYLGNGGISSGYSPISICTRVEHLWLSGVKMHFRGALSCFELEPRLHPEGDDKLATQNLRLRTCFLMEN